MDNSDIERTREIRLKNGEFFEKNLVYLSAGTIALMVGQISEVKSFICLSLFVLSLVLLILTLILSLAGYLLAIYFADRHLEETWNKRFKIENFASRQNRLKYLNYLCLISFSFSLILLCYFLSINLL